MKKKHAGNVFADCMVPVASVDDFEELVADVVNLVKRDKEAGFYIGMRVFAVLRRLQIAENQSSACAAALDCYESLERVGLYEGEADL